VRYVSGRRPVNGSACLAIKRISSFRERVPGLGEECQI
jgi:hypothetical protein